MSYYERMKEPPRKTYGQIHVRDYISMLRRISQQKCALFIASYYLPTMEKSWLQSLDGHY